MHTCQVLLLVCADFEPVANIDYQVLQIKSGHLQYMNQTVTIELLHRITTKKFHIGTVRPLLEKKKKTVPQPILQCFGLYDTGNHEHKYWGVLSGFWRRWSYVNLCSQQCCPQRGQQRGTQERGCNGWLDGGQVESSLRPATGSGIR